MTMIHSTHLYRWSAEFPPHTVKALRDTAVFQDCEKIIKKIN